MKTKFKEWAISYYKHRKIGNFAKDFLNDMNHDPDFPKSSDKNYILLYLRNAGACDNAIKGFNEMFEVYLYMV